MTTGSVQSTVLLKRAQTKSSVAKPYVTQRPEAPASFVALPPNPTNSSASIRLLNPKAPESTFLRSVIQATLSTCTGCTANTAAASQAVGTFKSESTRHNRIALMAWRSTLVRWYPAGASPQRWYSIQNVV